jgi:hypothetical protein
MGGSDLEMIICNMVICSYRYTREELFDEELSHTPTSEDVDRVAIQSYTLLSRCNKRIILMNLTIMDQFIMILS